LDEPRLGKREDAFGTFAKSAAEIRGTQAAATDVTRDPATKFAACAAANGACAIAVGGGMYEVLEYTVRAFVMARVVNVAGNAGTKPMNADMKL